MYQDKTLVCKECGQEFVFTAGEQEFYAERGFQNEPQRCKACRDARKNAARGPREYFTAVCARSTNSWLTLPAKKPSTTPSPRPPVTIKSGKLSSANCKISSTGIPVRRMGKDEMARLLDLEKELARTVVGQDEAIATLARALRRSRTGLRDPRRPIGSFLFLGPTGVGKTLLARTLATQIFGDEKALVQVDMSEYAERHEVSRLVGAPRDTSATTRAASSPSACAAAPTASCSSTRSRRRTPT